MSVFVSIVATVQLVVAFSQPQFGLKQEWEVGFSALLFLIGGYLAARGE